MTDYSFPKIKTTDLPEVGAMVDVKEVIVNTTTEKAKAISKSLFILPQNQISGLLESIQSLYNLIPNTSSLLTKTEASETYATLNQVGDIELALDAILTITAGI